MMNYTPGSHIVVGGVGAWLRVDPLRVLLPVTAAFVAVKAGIVYVLALRALPPRRASVIAALAAPVLLLVPAAFTIGSFFQFYLPRAGRVGDLRGGDGARGAGVGADAGVAGSPPRAASGVGVVLSWPVWIGPAAAAAAVGHARRRAGRRASVSVAIAAACLPAAHLRRCSTRYACGRRVDRRQLGRGDAAVGARR